MTMINSLNRLIKNTQLYYSRSSNKTLTNYCVIRNNKPMPSFTTYLVGGGKPPFSLTYVFIKSPLLANPTKFLRESNRMYATDFNLIYEDPLEIEVYLVGIAVSNPIKRSYNISANTNFTRKGTQQQVVYFKKPILIASKFIMDHSKEFMDDPTHKANFENTTQYKEIQRTIIEELQQKGIKVRIASAEEQHLTGFNILLPIKSLIPLKPKLFNMLI